MKLRSILGGEMFGWAKEVMIAIWRREDLEVRGGKKSIVRHQSLAENKRRLTGTSHADN